MVTGVFGLPGAGKSTFLAWCASRAQKGRSLCVGLGLAGGVHLGGRHYSRIYSNFPLLGCYPLEWDSLGVLDYSDCLILIDEIMMLADSRAWKTYPENIKYFFSMHRHYNVDLIWCSQSYKDCDVRIRNLCEQFLHIRRFGPFTEIIPIQHCMDIRNGTIDDWYELGGFLSRRFLRRAPYYNMFDTCARKVLQPLPELNLWEIADSSTPVELHKSN